MAIQRGNIVFKGGEVKNRSIAPLNQVGTDTDHKNLWGVNAPIYRTPPPLCGGNDSNTVFLIHNNGTEGQTSTTDFAIGGNAPHSPITFNGGAKLSTAQKKFGTASLKLTSATSDYLSIPDDTDFKGKTVYTWDFWARITSSGDWVVASKSTALLRNWVIYINAGVAGISFDTANIFITTGITGLNEWNHFAFVYNGAGATNPDKLKIAVNGIFRTTTDNAVPIPAVLATDASELRVGNELLSGRFFNGFLDEVRFSDIVRYTANFNPYPSEYTDFLSTDTIFVSPAPLGNDANSGLSCDVPILTLKQGLSRLNTNLFSNMTLIGNNAVWKENININLTKYPNILDQLVILRAEGGSEATIEFDEEDLSGEQITPTGLTAGTIQCLHQFREESNDYLIVGIAFVGIFKSTNGIAFSQIQGNLGTTQYGGLLAGGISYNSLSVIFKNKLYITAFETGMTGGHLLEITPTTRTVTQAFTDYNIASSIEVYNSFLYYSAQRTANNWRVYKSADGTIWTTLTPPNQTQQIRLISFKNVLYLLEGSGRIYTINPDNTFVLFHQIIFTDSVGLIIHTSFHGVINDTLIIAFFDVVAGNGIPKLYKSNDLKVFENFSITNADEDFTNEPLVHFVNSTRDNILYLWQPNSASPEEATSKLYRTVDGVNWIKLDKIATNRFYLSLYADFLGYLYIVKTDNTIWRGVDNIISTEANLILEGVKLEGNNKGTYGIYYYKNSTTQLNFRPTYNRFQNCLLDGVFADKVGMDSTYILNNIGNNCRNVIRNINRPNSLSFFLDLRYCLGYDCREDFINIETFQATEESIFNNSTMYNVRSFMRVSKLFEPNISFEFMIFNSMSGNDIANLTLTFADIFRSVLNQASRGINTPTDPSNINGNPLFINTTTKDFRLQTIFSQASNGQYFNFNSIAYNIGSDAGCYIVDYTNNDEEYSFVIQTQFYPEDVKLEYHLKQINEKENLRGDIKRSFVDDRLRVIIDFPDSTSQNIEHFYQLLRIAKERLPVSVYFNEPFNITNDTGFFTLNSNGTGNFKCHVNSYSFNQYRSFWIEIFNTDDDAWYEFFIDSVDAEFIEFKDLKNNYSSIGSVSNQDTQMRIRYINMTPLLETFEGHQFAFFGFQNLDNVISPQGYSITFEAFHNLRR